MEAADQALALALMDEGSGEEGAESDEEGGDDAGVNVLDVLEAFYDAEDAGDEDDDDDDERDGDDDSDADVGDVRDGDDDEDELEEEEEMEEEEEDVEVEVGGRRRTGREILFALLNSGGALPPEPCAVHVGGSLISIARKEEIHVHGQRKNMHSGLKPMGNSYLLCNV